VNFGAACVTGAKGPIRGIFPGKPLLLVILKCSIMPNGRYRSLLVASHPVQYAAPLFRQMAQHPKLDIEVAYCSLQGAEQARDSEFGVEFKWDIPLLEGYPWVKIDNKSPWPGLGRFFGLINPGLWRLIASGGYDVVVIYTGYMYLSFWIALVAAKFHRRVLIFGTDGHEVGSKEGKRWKTKVKRVFWPRLFGLADVVLIALASRVSA